MFPKQRLPFQPTPMEILTLLECESYEVAKYRSTMTWLIQDWPESDVRPDIHAEQWYRYRD